MEKLNKPARGIGVDIISLSRVEKFLKRHRLNLDKILTSKELAQLEKSKNPVELFAYFFSAKEAVFKSLDLEWFGVEGFRLIEVDLPERPCEDRKNIAAKLSGKLLEATQGRLSNHCVELEQLDDYIVAKAESY